MKREILRIHNLNYDYNLTSKLENISMCILEGECIGFLGLTYSGKDFLLQLLGGQVEEASGKFHVYIDGKKISDNKSLKEKVYHISARNYRIDNWTVAEYIGLVDAGWLYMLFHGKGLQGEIKDYFQKLSLQIDVSAKIRDLSENQKRIVDLVKALKKGAKIIVIEDAFEGMDGEDIKAFYGVMKRLISKRAAVIVNCHSNMIMNLLSDKYIIFSRGRIVKKCAKTYIKANAQLERFLLDENMHRKEKTDERQMDYDQEEIVYRIKGLRVNKNQRQDFEFAKGKVVTFLILDAVDKERIFMVLSGRKAEKETRYILNYQRYENVTPELFAEHKLVSIKNLGNGEEIFAQMSVGENLLLPSLGKISSLEYILFSTGIEKMIAEKIITEEGGANILAGGLEINEMITIILERWYIYNPKVLILFEPFALCDAYGVSIVKSYIKKFAARGTAVILVNSRKEYAEDISDQFIPIG